MQKKRYTEVPMRTESGVVGLEKTLKNVVEQAIEEKKDFFYQTFLEVFEDIGLNKAIEKGLHTGRANKQEIIDILHAD